MKHLRKFEELDYSTYISAADKLSQYGQKTKADRLKSHADQMEMNRINEISFDILVGETRVFNNAKFIKANVSRESNANGILCVFNSEPNNTHRIFATINKDGTVVWRDYNKFANRKSVNDYQRLLKMIANFNVEIKKLLSEMNLTPADIKVESRTFYI
jgi:YD repeat-containing protein